MSNVHIFFDEPTKLAAKVSPNISTNIIRIATAIELGLVPGASCACCGDLLPAEEPAAATVILRASDDYTICFFCSTCTTVEDSKSLMDSAVRTYQEHGSVAVDEATA